MGGGSPGVEGCGCSGGSDEGEEFGGDFGVEGGVAAEPVGVGVGGVEPEC